MDQALPIITPFKFVPKAEMSDICHREADPTLKDDLESNIRWVDAYTLMVFEAFRPRTKMSVEDLPPRGLDQSLELKTTNVSEGPDIYAHRLIYTRKEGD